MEQLAYQIIKDSDPLLRKKSSDVRVPLDAEDAEIAQFLHDYLVLTSDEKKAEELGARPGVGLAAPQIGQLKRIIAIYIPYTDKEGKITSITQFLLVNPKVLERSIRPAYLVSGEGCLSVDEPHPGHVIRSAFITIKAYDFLTKQYVKIKFRGYESIVVQHELDHLEGILFYDRIDQNNPDKTLEGAVEI